jgi:hypothetical protein
MCDAGLMLRNDASGSKEGVSGAVTENGNQ